ncbi:hypothetical protein N9A88_03455, partial [Akkermansiaceae bacterium]|nr:hypothetical protein [Akkermansiaceae bacterium]
LNAIYLEELLTKPTPNHLAKAIHPAKLCLKKISLLEERQIQTFYFQPISGFTQIVGLLIQLI